MTRNVTAAENPADRLEALVRQFSQLKAEIEALAGGEVDAVLAPSAGEVILLPGAHSALLRQEQEFRALVEHSPDPIARFDAGGRVLYANPAMEMLLGVDAAALHGRTLGEAGGELREWDQAVQEVAASGTPREDELALLRDGAAPRAFSLRVHPEVDARGQVESVLAIARDTTLRRTAEREVARSHEFLQASIDALSAHLTVVDDRGVLVAVNTAWRRFGEENEAASDFIGINYLDVCAAADGTDADWAREASEGIRSVLSGTRPDFTMVYPCDTPRGLCWFKKRVTALEAGGARYAAVAHENITAEHEAQARVEAERDRAVRILERVSDAFFSLDEDWRFTYLNPQAGVLLRQDCSALLGQRLWDAFPGTRGSVFEDEYRAVVRSGQPRTFQAHFPPLDAWYEVNAFPNGGGLDVYFQDITARRQREREAAQFTRRLAEERSLLEAVLQQLPVGVVIAEAPSGSLVLGNQKIAEIWKHGFLSSASVSEYGEWQGYHVDGTRVAAEEWPLARTIRTGERVVGETYEIVRADGTRGTARLSSSPVTDARGEIVAGVVVVADTTAETAAARALVAAEERYRLLFRATNDVVWDWDLVRETVEWNEALTTVLHHPRGEVTERPDWWVAGIHPDDRARVVASIDAAIHGTEFTWADEYRFARADGTYVRILDRAYLLRNAEGRAVRMIGAMLDLTERDRVEDAVRFQALLLETVQQAVVAADLDGVITAWNHYAEHLFGWPAAEAIGRTRAEVFGNETAAADRETMEAAGRGQSWSGELTLVRRDGHRVTVTSTRTPVLDANERLIGMVSVSSDLTEQRSLEEQLRQSQKMEAVGMLAGGVAHDFNNILTVISGNVSLLLSDASPDHADRPDLIEIADAADRAAALTRQLLAFSRRQILQPQNLQLNALVAGVLPMLGRLIGEDVQLHLQTRGESATVEADPGQLEQVLVNLVVNARDAMPQGGRISVETGVADFDGSQRAWDGSRIPAARYAVLCVTDTGVGMPPEVQRRIFEPFFTTKEVGRGTGLGLSTVYGIVRQSGGYVWVHSEMGRGTALKVYLPAVDAPETASTPPPPQAARGSETVLLVEDDDAVRIVARRALTRYGYGVLEARDGAEAIQMAGEHEGSIDLVLMDVVMPHLNGPAAAERVAEIVRDVPIIMMSGYTDDEVLRRGVLTSETRFLQKPFTPAALIQVIRAALDEPRA